MRGQTSVELMLVVVIVLAVAVYLMIYYNEETKNTIAMAVARQDADLAVSNASLYGCGAYLKNITLKSGQINITLHSDCNYEILNGTDVEQDIYLALGCHKGVNSCKGERYQVNILS